jgi:putative serine protease PepD
LNTEQGKGEATIPDALQTDASINPENSGGAMVDVQGNLIDIPTLAAIEACSRSQHTTIASLSYPSGMPQPGFS